MFPGNLWESGRTAIQVNSEPETDSVQGSESPRIVDKSAREKCNRIQAEKPGREQDHNRMETEDRGKGDKNADGECQGDFFRGTFQS